MPKQKKDAKKQERDRQSHRISHCQTSTAQTDQPQLQVEHPQENRENHKPNTYMVKV